MVRRVLLILISVLVSGALMWFALRSIDLQQIYASLITANVWLLLASFVMAILSLWTRGVRWRGLVNDQLSTEHAFYMFSITMLLNQIPLRLGEVARSVLAQREGIPIATAATSIIVERLLDLVFVLSLLGLCFTQLTAIPAEIAFTVRTLSVLAVVGFGVLLAFARYRTLAHQLLTWFLNRLPFLKRLHLTELLDQVLDGLRPLTNWRKLLFAVAWTIISWGISIVTIYLIQISVQGVPLDTWLLSGLIASLASLAIAVPLSVASVGPLENAVLAAGNLLGFSATTSLAMGLLFHGVSVATYLVCGTLGIVRMGVTLGDVMQEKK